MLAAAIAAPKISFETLGMIPSPRVGNKMMLVIDAEKIGLHRRKFHHSFLSIMQSRFVPKAEVAAIECRTDARGARQPIFSNRNLKYQNGFQVGLSVNLSQPRLAPSRRPIPERIGTTTILLPVSAVMPKPPTR
jgi:hypothetical protein